MSRSTDNQTVAPVPKAPRRPKTRRKQADPLVFEEVNVLVTSFGDANTNGEDSMTWLVASGLPPILPVSPAHPSRIRISIPQPINKKTYAAIDSLTPEMMANPSPQTLVLHLGVASDRTYYSLESRAHSDGYTIQDDTDSLPADRPEYFGANARVLSPSTSFEDVLARWQSDSVDADVRISVDAEFSLCEYQFYSSLAYLNHNGNSDQTWENRTSVALLRIPRPNGSFSFENSRKVIIALIYALIDSRRSRDGDYDTTAEVVEE